MPSTLLPEGVECDIHVYATDGELEVRVSLKGLTIIPEEWDALPCLLKAVDGLSDHEWRLMSYEETKQYKEDNDDDRAQA